MAIDIIHEYFPGTKVEWEVRIVLFLATCAVIAEFC